MSAIELLLCGELDPIDFMKQVAQNLELQNELRSLIPEEAKNNESHPIWNNNKHVTYSVIRWQDFDYLAYLYRIVYSRGVNIGGIGDKLNIYSLIERIYSFHHPDAQYTDKYQKMHDLYLCAVGDTFEGEEVQELLERIICDAFPLKTKKAQIAQIKSAIKEQFHLEDKKRPSWIQGGEWPMGRKSPMKFLSRKRKGECVHYEFIDVDTGETRIIEQYY